MSFYKGKCVTPRDVYEVLLHKCITIIPMQTVNNFQPGICLQNRKKAEKSPSQNINATKRIEKRQSCEHDQLPQTQCILLLHWESDYEACLESPKLNVIMVKKHPLLDLNLHQWFSIKVFDLN
ncbi:hypothetical protein AV530_006478 [Patagioenas fasciata monilis]|uniref:Uncharacterized protein n=1 Tax=Patagioenas fasciata monilis TaxID=372326 RepID=A0A1V4KGQ5_PATFA|nr:hypothetical protein AV530_006478 [Patagioenas fasciata monilis]